jgi:hypothetical protein
MLLRQLYQIVSDRSLALSSGLHPGQLAEHSMTLPSEQELNFKLRYFKIQPQRRCSSISTFNQNQPERSFDMTRELISYFFASLVLSRFTKGFHMFRGG